MLAVKKKILMGDVGVQIKTLGKCKNAAIKIIPVFWSAGGEKRRR